MKTTCFRAGLVLATVVLGGCSDSEQSQVSDVPMSDTLAAASINSPAATSGAISSVTAGSHGSANGVSNTAEPFRNPFAPPKAPPPPVIEQPDPEPELPAEPTPEVRQPGVPPTIRLLGFMNIGEPKVLVSYHNSLETLAIGDTLEDMEVVKIESPDLTMLFEEREVKLSLFDQAWRHESGAASGNNTRVETRPRTTRPTSNARTSASVGATTGGPTRGSSVPGFTPNAGKPPGFRPPSSPGIGSPPGAPVGDPPIGLPGLNGGLEGGAEIGDSDFPGIPSLDLDAGGMLDAGTLPTLPGGL